MSRRLRRPVEHDVVEQLVPVENVFGVAVAIGPGPEFFRIQAACPLGESVSRSRVSAAASIAAWNSRVEIDVMLEPRKRTLLFRRRLALDLRRRVEGQRDVDAGAMLGVLHAERGRYRRAPVAALRAVARVSRAGPSASPRSPRCDRPPAARSCRFAEKPKPGSEGQTTWKASAGLPPCATGSTSGAITF